MTREPNAWELRLRENPDHSQWYVERFRSMAAAGEDIVGEALHDEGWKTIRIPQPLAKAGIILQNEALGSDDFIQPWMIDSSNDHYILDISRARLLLGWEPKHRLRDTLPTIVAALKRHPRRSGTVGPRDKPEDDGGAFAASQPRLLGELAGEADAARELGAIREAEVLAPADLARAGLWRIPVRDPDQLRRVLRRHGGQMAAWEQIPDVTPAT